MIIKPYRNLFARIPEAEYKEAVEFFRAHGVSTLGYSENRRCWSFMAMGRPGEGTVIIRWVDLDDFVAMVRDRAGTLQALWDHGAKVQTLESDKP